MENQKNNTPRVSVVIPSYKRPDLIVRAVGSALAQDFRDFEILVVDDNGKGTPLQRETEQAIETAFTDPRIRYIPNDENLGGGGARNTGITHACGEFVAFLDDDEDWLPTKLTKQVAVFDAMSIDVGVVDTGFYESLDEQRTVEYYPEMQGWILDSLLDKKKRRAPKLSTIMCRTILLREIGMFDPRFPARQDLDLFIRLSRVCRFESVQELLAYKRSDANVRISGSLSGRIRGSELLYEKIREDLSRRPSAHAAYLFRHAALQFAANQKSDALETLRRSHGAARHNPFILVPQYLRFPSKVNSNRRRHLR